MQNGQEAQGKGPFLSTEGIEKGRKAVTALIRNYYKKAKGVCPDAVEKREFGVGTFDTKILYRHLSFATEAALRAYLVEKAPPYVSYSAAYYKLPSHRPMESKLWEGSELVFDLDVTDMHLPCQKAHGSSWVCNICFDSVKAEAIKLIEEFLIPDFGFSTAELSVNFSGNRGYHVHIKRESVLGLSAKARAGISDYISGSSIDAEFFFPTAGQRGMRLIGPKPDEKGWGGKIARAFLANLNNGTERLVSLGVSPRLAANLYKKRALIEMGIRNGNWDMVYIPNKASFWREILKNQAISQSDKIDRNVTKDPSHLIRLPGSIHGETGLVAVKVAKASLDRFDPTRDAIAFTDGEITCIADTKERLILNNEEFGPYKKERAVLPTYAAVYLFLKGRASME